MMVVTGKPPDGADLAAMQEQLTEARAEVERLQSQTADAEARALTAVAEAAALRGELAAAHEERESAAGEAQSARTYLEAAEARLRTAAEKYRDLVVKTEPELPAELIAGDDVDTVEASAASARELVGRVRTHIEEKAQAARVPAGAPPRGAPDYGGLSPEEKIRVGLAMRG
jgi:hypothetical protein